MIIVSCSPPQGFDVYRCGWRLEERDGRMVRIGLCWPAGVTVLPDDALTAEQLDALRRDPGKRITVRHIEDPAPADAKAGLQQRADEPRPAPDADIATPAPSAPLGRPASDVPPCASVEAPARRAPHRARVTGELRRAPRARLVNEGPPVRAHLGRPPPCASHSRGPGPPPRRAALAAPCL